MPSLEPVNRRDAASTDAAVAGLEILPRSMAATTPEFPRSEAPKDLAKVREAKLSIEAAADAGKGRLNAHGLPSKS
jgi:hypothetical protein